MGSRLNFPAAILLTGFQASPGLTLENLLRVPAACFLEADLWGNFDEVQAWSLLDVGETGVQYGNREDFLAHKHVSDRQKQSILNYIAQRKQPTRVGYVPGVVRQVDALTPLHISGSGILSDGLKSQGCSLFKSYKTSRGGALMCPSSLVTNDPASITK